MGVGEARCIPAIKYMGLCGRSKESRAIITLLRGINVVLKVLSNVSQRSYVLINHDHDVVGK